MKDAEAGRWGWLRVACAAAAAAAIFFALWTIYLAGSAWINLRSEKVERRALEQEITSVEPSSTRAHSNGGRVVLDFAVGHFSLEPGEAREPIRVEGDYDVNSYELEAHFESSVGPGWVYHVTFREIGWLRDGGLRGLFGGAYPAVRVYLPPDVPYALEGHFGKGVTDVELGGLWLTEIDLDVEKGAFNLSIGEPLVNPVDVVRIRGTQGSLDTRSLGNASPGQLEIDFRMGRASVDLRGLWLNDANVLVQSVMAGSEIVLPRDVRIAGLEGHVPIVVAQDPELPPPTLRVSVSRVFGGLSVVD
jgi:hypothetical protein